MFSSYPSRQRTIKRIIFWTILIAAFLAFFMPNLVRALAVSDPTLDPCVTFETCIDGLTTRPTEDTGGFAKNIILQLADIVAYICGSLAILFMMKAAWDMMNSGGDSGKYQKAITSMGYAIMGLVVIAASWGIIATVLNFLANTQI